DTVQSVYELEGKIPSYDEIRDSVGGASYNTVSKGIRIWKKKQAEQQEQEKLKSIELTNELLNFRDLVDHSTDSLFVIDPQSGVIVDCNASAFEILGYSEKEFLQLKIFEISASAHTHKQWLEQFDVLRTQDKIIKETRHQRKDGTFIDVEVSARLYKHNDSEYIICSSRDISDRKILINKFQSLKIELQHKIKHEKILSELSSDLLNIKNNQIDQVINKTLKNLTLLTDSDRSYLFEVSKDKTFIKNTYEWCAPGIKPQISSLQHCQCNDFEWLLSQFSETKIIFLEKENIPDDSVALLSVFNKGNINSILNIPLFTENRFQGFIGLDNPSCCENILEQNISLLKTVANILSKAFQQWHIEQLHEYSKKEAQRYLQIAGVMILALDRQGEVTMINDKGCEILGYPEDYIIGKNWFDHFLPNDYKDEVLHIFNELIAGDINSFQTIGDGIVQRSDHTKRWISWHNNLLVDSSGETIGILSSGEDITERKFSEQQQIFSEKKIKKEKDFLQTIINGVTDPIMVIGTDYKVQLMNSAACSHVNKSDKDKSYSYCYQISHNSDKPCHFYNEECPLIKVLDTKKQVTVLHEHYSHNNTKRIFELNASPIFNDEMEITAIIESSRDITDRLKAEKELYKSNLDVHRLTYHDQLTNLPNQQLLKDRLEQIIVNASEKQTHVSVFHLDIDRFKHLNETFGRNNGDEILITVSERLKKLLKKSDTLAHFGADEFTIVSNNTIDIDNTALLARQILDVFNTPFCIEDQNYHLTVSVGISLFPQDGNDADILLNKADTALHNAKDDGRNSFQFYQEDMTEQTFAYVMMESNLRKSLSKNELVLFYQPKIDLNDGKLCGLEALIRWQHEDMGLVSPSRFIPIAEESGLIIDIGEWVFRTACMQALKWSENGYVFGRIAVNLSSKQFSEKSLSNQIRKILSETGCPAHLIELEITESHLMDDVQYAVQTLEDIKNLGIKLSIDDFGTGYSSMSQLKQLPIDTLKIDQSFVKDLPENSQDKAISQAIIALGTTMGLTIIAEGIETQEQADFLKLSGCKQGQGFLFHKPLTTNEITRILKTAGS
ncbi:MAG: EAL domain-containing protein, partial [Gammaproteobacteria bacterium]|nr:EAL domain-containing protein [Gammaproteobacteria bacterium]